MTSEYINYLDNQRPDIQRESTETLVGLGIDRGIHKAKSRQLLRNGLKRALKVVPFTAVPLLLEDVYSGYTKASDIYNTDTPSYTQRGASAIGGLVNGLTLGIVDANSVSKWLSPTTDNMHKETTMTPELQRYMNSKLAFKAREDVAKALGNISGDYDYSLAGDKGQYGHYTDAGKLPNHPTFSNQSRYSGGKLPGGNWSQGLTSEGSVIDRYTPSQQMVQDGRADKLPEYIDSMNAYHRGMGDGLNQQVKLVYPAPYKTPRK